MKLVHCLATPLLLLSTPALATGGYACTAEGTTPTTIEIVTGHGVAPAIAQVRLSEGEKLLSTAGNQPQIVILQSWMDADELRLDLVDPKVERYEARLRVRNVGPLTAAGTLERAGRTLRVRCTGDQ